MGFENELVKKAVNIIVSLAVVGFFGFQGWIARTLHQHDISIQVLVKTAGDTNSTVNEIKQLMFKDMGRR